MPNNLASIGSKIREAITRYQLFEDDDYILVGVSGGPDSVFLAYILRYLGYKIGLAHVNYQLRGDESEADEVLVRQYAAQWDVPIFVNKTNTSEILAHTTDSMQMVAREIRYTFFEQIMDTHAFSHCAIAHHANDQVENLLMSLIQGNNSHILKGMPMSRQRYVRPMLSVTGEEIMAGLSEAQLEWRLDQSNLKSDYLRNKYRNELIPLIRELQADAEHKLLHKHRWYQLQHKFIRKQLQAFVEQGLTHRGENQMFDWNPFEKAYGKEFLPLLIVLVLERWGIHGHLLWECLRLEKSQVGKWVQTPEGRVVRGRKGLSYITSTYSRDDKLTVTSIEEEKRIIFGGLTLTFSLQENNSLSYGKNHFYMDLSSVRWPLYIRHWHKGDKMRPFGMRQSKKLSDIFVDEKYSAIQKQAAIIIEDQEEIIALSDFRIAEKVKVSKKGSKVLCIAIAEN